MSDVFVLMIFATICFALPASQFYALSFWYQIVKLIDEVPLPDRRKVGWPDIHHTDPGVWIAASGLCSRTMRTTYFRVLLRGLPQSRSIPLQAYSKAKIMRRCMLFAVALFLTLVIAMMRGYELVIMVAFILASIRWLVGDWNEAAIVLETAPE